MESLKEPAMSSHRSDVDLLHLRVDEIAYYVWDPIGVRDDAGPRNEYRSYVPQLHALVRAGELTGLLEYMERVVTVDMGMKFTEYQLKRANSAARLMLMWGKKYTHDA